MIKINKDNINYKKIQKAIKENDGYCPCKIKRIQENKCICEEFKKQEKGICHCGLYIKE